MTERPEPSAAAPTALTRRAFGCAALFGISGPLLVACGDDGTADGAGSTPTSPTGAGSPSSSGGSTSAAAGLVAAADVPVGGGVIISSEQIVVTQPTEGEFKAFSSVCTHQGSQLSAVGDGKITCPLHGSQFSVDDGSNVTGPNGTEGGSVADLPEIPVTVTKGQVVRA